MANEFQVSEYPVPGLTTLVAVCIAQAGGADSGKYLRDNSSAYTLESLTEANWAQYQFALSEVVAGSATYMGSFPTGWTVPQEFDYYVYDTAAGTSFANRSFTGYSGVIAWSGTAESVPLASGAANATNVGMTGTSINATSSGGGGVAKDSIGPATQSVIVPASTAAFTSAFTFTLASAANKLSIEIDNTAGAQDINCQLELNAGNGTQAFMAPGGAISVGAGQKGTLAIGNNAMQALPAAYGGAVYIRSATGTGGTWNIGFNGSAA